jgi:hypothetical protein
MTDELKPPYDVGFGKPPKDTQYKAGKSGNPRGRPRGSRNLATLLGRALREKVVVNEGGMRRRVSKAEAAVKQLVNKAAGGDLAAMRLLTGLESAAEAELPRVQGAPQLSETDQKFLNEVFARFQETERASDTEPK